MTGTAGKVGKHRHLICSSRSGLPERDFICRAPLTKCAAAVATSRVVAELLSTFKVGQMSSTTGVTLMRTLLLGGLLAAAVVSPALAQSNPPANRPDPQARTTAPAPAAQSGLWRTSKLNGLNVYNDKNEKLGDIKEILVDKSGRVQGVIIGVGGFLGVGEHDIKVDMAKLKFVNDPPRTETTASGNRPTNDRVANTSADRKWYPDHAVLSASKDQLKAMPQFKY
jgi:sporulation protein YlmC with PRC-barrel domain